MKKKAGTFIIFAWVLLPLLSGAVRAEERTADPVWEPEDEGRHLFEFDVVFERTLTERGYMMLPFFDGCYYRSAGEGYSVPYLNEKVPVEGEVTDVRMEFFGPETFGYDPVPFPHPDRGRIDPLDLPEHAEIPFGFSYETREELLSDGKVLDLRISPVEYTADGKLTVYSTALVTYTVANGMEEEPDVLPGNKPTGDIMYLIITTEELKDALEPLADWKSQKGKFAHIETVEDISERYEGTDRPEKIRNYIMEVANEFPTEYLLLAGDHNDVPVRKTLNDNILISGVEPDYFASDIYYACIDPNTTWDRDGDGIFGEVGDIDDPELDLVYGRLAIHEPKKMREKVSELISREKAPAFIDLEDNTAIMADELGSDPENSDYCEAILDRRPPDHLDILKMYHDGTGDENFSVQNVKELFEDSYPINIYMGHGYPDQYRNVISNDDVESFSQEELGGYLFAMSCLTGWFDDPRGYRQATFDDCLGEAFTETVGAGVVGYSGSNRLAVSLSTTQLYGDVMGMQEFSVWASDMVAGNNIEQTAGVIHALAMIEFSRKFQPFNDPYKTEIRTYLSYNFLGDPNAPLVLDEVEELQLEYDLSGDKGSVDATVTNATGTPLSDVVVTLYRKGELGVSARTNGTGSVSIDIPRNNGGRINITAYRPGDRPAFDSFDLPDNLPPKPVVRTSPAFPDGENKVFVTVPDAFIYADEESSIEYRIDGGETKTSDSEVPVELKEGENMIEIKATDMAGHVSEWHTFLIPVDLTEPELLLATDPAESDGADGWFVSDTTLTVSCPERLQELNISVDGGEPETVEGPVEVLEGVHNYTVRAKDLSGRTSVVEITLKLDREPPVSSRMEVSKEPDGKNGFYVTVPTIEFKVFHEDSRMEYRWGEGEWMDGSSPISPGEGIHLLEWRAIDLAGNIGSGGTREFKVDTIAPSLEYSVTPEGPDGERGIYRNAPVFTASSVDGVVTCSVVPYGEDADWKRAGSIPEEGVEVPEGRWSIYARSEDEAGNTAFSDRWDLVVDATDPDLTVSISPARHDGENGWYKTPVVIEPITSEKDLGVTITLDGEIWSSFTSPVYLSDGTYDVSVRAVDPAGNEIVRDLGPIKVDMTRPTISWLRPEEDAVFGNEAVTITWDASDGMDEELSSFISIDRGEWTEAASVGTFDLEGLSHGDHDISLKVVDNAGNMDSATTRISIDSEAPEVVEFSPSEEGLNPDDISIIVRYSEDMEPHTSVMLLNGEETDHYWTSDRMLSADLEGLEKGTTFEVRVSAYDVHGNPTEELVFSFSTSERDPVEEPPAEDESGGNGLPVLMFAAAGMAAVALLTLAVGIVLIVKKRASG